MHECPKYTRVLLPYDVLHASGATAPAFVAIILLRFLGNFAPNAVFVMRVVKVKAPLIVLSTKCGMYKLYILYVNTMGKARNFMRGHNSQWGPSQGYIIINLTTKIEFFDPKLFAGPNWSIMPARLFYTISARVVRLDN